MADFGLRQLVRRIRAQEKQGSESTFVLFPGYAESGIARYVELLASVAEIGIFLWLLMMGTRESKRA